MSKAIKKGGGRKQISAAMMTRIAALESKLSRKLVSSRVSRPKKGHRSGNLGAPRGPNKIAVPRGMGGQQIGNTAGGMMVSKTSTTRRAQVIEEDEYIGEVNGSVAFATTSYAVNPGQSPVFPWGSKIAALYEEYDFEYIEFYYTSEVSQYSTQGQTGVVILSADYDASDTAPVDKQQVEDTDPHTRPCLPSFSVLRLSLDCKQMRKNLGKYVRPGALPANTDIKTYDSANVYVSTQGQTNGTNIGELHVRYRCRLSKPVLENSQISGGVAHFSGIAPTTGNNFATAVLQPGNTPSFNGITLGTNTIVFPSGIPGNYLLCLSVGGSTSASALGYSSGGTVLNFWTQSNSRDENYISASLAGTTTAVAWMGLTLAIPAAGATVTITPSTVVGATGSMDLWIVSLPPTVVNVDVSEQREIDKLKSHSQEQDRKIAAFMDFMNSTTHSGEDDPAFEDHNGCIRVDTETPSSSSSSTASRQSTVDSMTRSGLLSLIRGGK